MARGTKSTMRESGVDTKILKPRSSKSAATSAATIVGVTIDDASKQGNWTNASIFCKYYCQENENTRTFIERLLLKYFGNYFPSVIRVLFGFTDYRHVDAHVFKTFCVL